MYIIIIIFRCKVEIMKSSDIDHALKRIFEPKSTDFELKTHYSDILGIITHYRNEGRDWWRWCRFDGCWIYMTDPPGIVTPIGESQKERIMEKEPEAKLNVYIRPTEIYTNSKYKGD